MTRYLSPFIHAAAVAALFFAFGPKLLSLSVDLAHHFTLIDALATEGTTNLPHVNALALYPQAAHWAAVALGYVTGSGLVAMWLICIAAIYLGYTALGAIIATERGFAAIAIFVVAIALSRMTLGSFGFEIVRSFLYAQLVGTAVYLVTLLFALRYARRPWITCGVTLLVLTLLLSIHATPALHLWGSVFVFALCRIGLHVANKEPVPPAELPALAALGGGGIGIILLHPSFAAIRTFAQHEGSLEFGLRPELLFFGAVAVLAVIGWRIWRSPPARSDADLLVASALATAIGLTVTQFVALKLLDIGSLYSVKKHLFIAVTMGAAGIARTIIYEPRPAVVGRNLAAGVAGLAGALAVLVQPTINVPLYPIVRAIDYAELALKTGQLAFVPGNTVALAKSNSPVINYLVATTIFRMDIAINPAAGILTGQFDPIAVPFAMIDRPDAKEGCRRIVETSRFVIVPTSCLR